MDLKKLSQVRRFKSAPQTLKPASADTPLSIDAEKGIIYNVIMCQAGPAKGHGVHLEQSFIEALVAYDNAHFSNGLKARFDHPALCEGTMGTQLGKFSNFRVVGDKAIADLKLLSAADSSPKHPQMREWTLNMAQESPDFLMSSIVFKQSGAYQYNAFGEKVQLYRVDNKDVVEELNEYNPDYGNVYVEMGQHFYTDIVEAGAATDSLFSEQFNADKFGIRAIEFFNDNTEVLDFLKENPAKITEFLSKLGIEMPDEVNDTLVNALARVTELETELSTRDTRITELETENESYKTTQSELNTQLSTANARITELETEVAELKEQPAGTPAGGAKGGDDTPDNTDNEELSSFGSGLKNFARSRNKW